MTKCNFCGREFKPVRKAFFASQDTYALAEMISNLTLELHMLSHAIPIGKSLEIPEYMKPH